MLTRLDIENIVLIERLSLQGEAGLVALTGETGAGKSILLDALGLSLGARAETRHLRHGADQATVTASFDLDKDHPVFDMLSDKGISYADRSLILRRTLGSDGRSKSFINDVAVTVQFLKDVGEELVEIHGQFATQGLLNPATHGKTLDLYGGIQTASIKNAYQTWQKAKKKYKDAVDQIQESKRQVDYLTYAVKELEKLNPQKGEEESLKEKRTTLMNADKIAGSFEQIHELMQGEDGIQNKIGILEGILSKNLSGSPLNDHLARAKAEIDDLMWQLEQNQSGSDGISESLDDIEERYFALKDCAKKHGVAVNDLSDVWAELDSKLKLITDHDHALEAFKKAVTESEDIYVREAKKISQKRIKACTALAKSVNVELPALKLERAKFFVNHETLTDTAQWGATGFDKIQFNVSTNPQTPAGPLHKIASGGELSRFMLALKVILAETGSVPTLIFDEVDSAVGGATADAVGLRLQKLSAQYQILVITHSPQVAGRAKHHWHVMKTDQKGTVITHIKQLSEKTDRMEEIARMLSGAEITTEARAQATKLLETQHAA